MLNRVHVEKILESWDSEPTYRVCEADGTLCECWLPGVEPPEPQPLDRGGFTERADATAFKLGIDRERALHGLIPESVEEIDRERAELDCYHAKPQSLPEAPKVMCQRHVA